MIKGLILVLKKLVRRLREQITMHQYTDFTVAEYFRLQGADIGECNRIMIRSLGQEPYLIKIGSHCSISSGVIFINHDGGGWVFTDEIPSLQRFGTIEIKDNCFIGLNCTILPNVTIGPNTVIGACSVVTRDVPPNSVACGNPARVVKSTEQYKEKILEIWQHQMPAGYFHDVRAGETLLPAKIQALKDRDHMLLKNHLTRTLMKSSDQRRVS